MHVYTFDILFHVLKWDHFIHILLYLAFLKYLNISEIVLHQCTEILFCSY